MGNSQAKPRPPSPPAPKLTSVPWRNNTLTCNNMRDEILRINPGIPANVLLLGPTGAGKSSLINSILTTAKDRRVNMAYAGSKETSFTTKYERYMADGILQHCCLWDSMGIEQLLTGGLLLDDLVYLLQGHIKRGYNFNTRSKISESDHFFRKNPKIEDRVHCVIFVLDANMIDEDIIAPFMPKIKSLQDASHSLNVPCNLIITKIDELCPEVDEDISKTFRSIKVQKAVREASSMFGIPEGNIHPVKNYGESIETDDATSILILIALKQMMYFASDNIEEWRRNQGRACILS